MVAKTDNLMYNVNDRPPWPALLLLAMQHNVIISSLLTIPIALMHELGGTFSQIQAVVCFTMIAAGIGTILQSIKTGPIGSGYLCPNLPASAYLSVSVHAAWAGGLPLLHGMIIIAGLCEVIFSRCIKRLQFLFPTPILGLVVFMVGVALIPMAASKFVGIEYTGEPVIPKNVLVACVTLLLLIGINIWGQGRLRLYNILAGLVVGYLLSHALGILTVNDWRYVFQVPWFQFPGTASMFQWSFDGSLVLPFVIVSLCSALKAFGNIVTCQKINDDAWRTPDMKTVSRGLLADALSTVFSGLLGGVALSTSASNVGLSAATGATSRWIGFAAGGLFVVMAFLPKVTALISIAPEPVMGAILIYTTSAMLVSGVRIITTQTLSPRMIYTIGISLTIGLSADILPNLYVGLPAWLKAFFNSSLILSTSVAVVLNQVFRLNERLRGNIFTPRV